MTRQSILYKPEALLLGIQEKNVNKEDTYLIIHVAAARILFAQKWKAMEVPSEEELIKKIMSCAELDRLTKRLKNQEDTEFY